MLFHRLQHKRNRKLRRCWDCQRLEERRLFSVPILPTIPPGSFNVTTYGASTASSDNTAAIQTTINTAHNAGGGTVVVPSGGSGTFLSGPLTLFNSINLEIDGELQMLAFGTYPGTASFITGSKLTNVEVSGTGRIDGQGSPWWSAFTANNTLVRPYGLIGLSQCTYVQVTGVTLTNPPNTHLDIQNNCSNVTINGMTINTPVSPNTDGIDLSANTALVENCNIADGDDNIAMGGTNLTIINDTFGIGHGLSIGSYTTGGTNGLTVNNCTFTGTVAGIRLKSERGRGGLVQNLNYSNITMTNVQYPINIHSYYNQGSLPNTPQDPPQPVTSTSNTPDWQNISISNLTSTNSASNSYCAIIWGVPELPVENIALSNVKISAGHGVDLNHVRNIHFDSQCKFTPASGGTYISTSSASTPYDASYWIDQDINAPAAAGNTLYSLTGTYNISGGGAGIGGSTDQFNFDSATLTGDATLIANLTSQSSASGSAAGVMVRESTAGNASFAAVLLGPSGGISFVSRNGSVSTAAAAGPANWVKLVRFGNNFTGYYSSNGTSWIQIGSTLSISMSGSVLAGLAATSGTNSAAAPLNPAVFSNVELLQVTTAAFPATTSLNTSSTALTVYAGDALNDSGLIYTWSALTIPTGAAAPTYSVNGTNASNYTTVNFSSPGTYALQVTVHAAGGSVITSATTNIVVNIPLTTLTGTAGPDTFLLVRSGTLLNIYVNNNNTPAYSLTYASQGLLTIDGNGGADSVSLVFLSGNPVPGAGLTLANTGGTTALTVAGTSGADTATINTTGMTFDGASISCSNTGSIALNISSGSSAAVTQAQAGSPALSLTGSNANTTLSISAGNFTISAPAQGVVPYTLGSLNISTGAKVILQSAASLADRTVLVLGNLSIAGQLDAGSNDMLIHNGNLPALSALSGITSSSAAGDTTHLSTLAVIQNSVDGTNTAAALYTSFDTTAVTSTDVLIRYTYYGDANLDGKVDGSDYTRIDSGFLSQRTGWFNGDFNSDGAVNGSDYTLIDNAFNRQGVARPAASIANVPGGTPTPGLSGSREPNLTVDPSSDFLFFQQEDLARRRGGTGKKSGQSEPKMNTDEQR